jgi:integrase
MPYRRGPIWWVAVPTRTGRMKRSTGTAHKPTAARMERMLLDLGPRGRRRWDVLERLVDGSLTLGRVLDAWDRSALDELLAAFADEDVAPLVEPFLEQHRREGARGRPVTADTIDHYETVLRSEKKGLTRPGVPFLRSQFTRRHLQAFLDAYSGSNGTRRKAQAALRQFGAFLVRRGVLLEDPTRGLKAPAPGKPRDRYLDTPEAKALADAQPEPYRTLAALMAGSGIEVSVAVQLRRRHVLADRKSIHARGTKAHTRDRIVRVAEWAWPYVAAHLAGLRPEDRLFPNTDRWRARDVHVAACTALKIDDYRLHDHRHSWAVRAVRAGWPLEAIARQLGHANATMVLKVYGRYRPTFDELDRLERLATAKDRQQFKDAEAVGTYLGTVAPPPNAANRVSPYAASSRGGTRTHDPGIMSAVL